MEAGNPDCLRPAPGVGSAAGAIFPGACAGIGAMVMKYIICEDFSGRPIPFLFPDKVAHADMREQLPYARVISAGYIILTEGRFVCSGGDAEIGYFARPEDAEYIGIFFDRRGLA
jgi:hypothetical protein